MLLQERPVSVQILPEVRVAVLVGLIQSKKIPGIFAVHVPAITVVVPVGAHILLEAAVPISFTGVDGVRGIHVVVFHIPLQDMVVAHHERADHADSTNVKIGIHVGNIQILKLIDANLIVDIHNQPLHNGYLLAVVCEQNVMMHRAGNRSNLLGVSDIVDHFGQGNRLGCQDCVTVVAEEAVQNLHTKVQIISLGKLTAGEEYLIQRLPVRLNLNALGDGIKNLAELCRGIAHEQKCVLGNDHFPVGSWCVDKLCFIPNAYQLKKFPEIAFYLPLLVFLEDRKRTYPLPPLIPVQTKVWKPTPRESDPSD